MLVGRGPQLGLAPTRSSFGEQSANTAGSLNGSGPTQALTGHGRPTTDTAAIAPASCGAVPDRVADTSDTRPRAFADMSATLTSDRKRLSAEVDIVRTHGHHSGSDVARQMGRCLHRMSERTGLRWRDRARNTAGAPESGPCTVSACAGHPTPRDNDLLVRKPMPTSTDSAPQGRRAAGVSGGRGDTIRTRRPCTATTKPWSRIGTGRVRRNRVKLPP